jgi:hypothetical protein
VLRRILSAKRGAAMQPISASLRPCRPLPRLLRPSDSWEYNYRHYSAIIANDTVGWGPRRKQALQSVLLARCLPA